MNNHIEFKVYDIANNDVTNEADWVLFPDGVLHYQNNDGDLIPAPSNYFFKIIEIYFTNIVD